MAEISDTAPGPFSIQNYRQTLENEAEELITKSFQKTVIKLNELLSSPLFNETYEKPEPEVEPDFPTGDSFFSDFPRPKKTKIGATLPQMPLLPPLERLFQTNKGILQKTEAIKPLLRQFLSDLNVLKLWITMSVPKIDGGNGLGPQVQAAAIAELEDAEDDASDFFADLSSYFEIRADYLAKVFEYPHVLDFRKSVRELDEQQFHTVSTILVEIRNRYCSLHDFIIKNWEKIKRPTSDVPDGNAIFD